MSKIERMQIMGIRSFGPTHGEVIRFNAPLTLIVGWNGSGKTTIIECLNKTGGAFIHDPKLVGEKEMMAQVKLGFQSTLQVTLKKTTRTQKTLEGSLEMKRDGLTETISSRVAELDQILPQYLGVLWPMSEPSNLKKKFDSIFEAEKYTKAIDNIKVIRKQQKHAKENKLRGEKSEERQARLFDEMEEMRTRFEAISIEYNDAHQKSREAWDHAAKFERSIAQLNGKRVAFQTNKENVTSLEDNLKILAESDAELETMLDQYQERVQHYEEERDERKGQWLALQKDLQGYRNSLGAKQNQHARNLLKRENLIRETAIRHNIRGFEHDTTNDQIADFQQLLGKHSREQSKTLERVRKEVQEELQEAQAEVNRLSGEKLGLNQRRDIGKTQITTNDKRISELQATMNKIQTDEGAEAILLDRKQETEKQLEKAHSTATNCQYDDQMLEAEKTVSAVDAKKERLESELVEATQLAAETAQVDFAQNKLKGAKHSLETMKNVHNARISKLVDPEWDAVSERAAKVKEAESRRDIAQSKLDNLQYKLSNVESEQKRKRAEFQKYEKTVLDAISKDDISDFDKTMTELEENYELTSSDQAKIEAQLEYMQACLKVAKEHNQCRLCKRMLKDDKADHFTRAGFISGLEGTVAKALKNAATENADELFAELETVRNAKPSYELAIRARDTELPTLKKELEKLASEREVIIKELEEHDAIISDLQSSKQEIDILSPDVLSILKYYNEVCELETEMGSLKKMQKAGGLSRGINAIREDLQKATDESRTIKATLANISNEREKSRKLISTLEIRVRDINAELNAAQASLKEKQALAVRIGEYRAENTRQREAIRVVDADIESLIPQVEQAQVNHGAVNRRGIEKVQGLHEQASKLSDSVRQLAEAEKDIRSYIDKGGPQRLAKTRREMEEIQQEIQRIEQEMSQVARDIKQMEETLSNTEHTKQSIFDNLRYRRAKRALETLEREIQELEDQGAENDLAHWEAEARHWDDEHQRLNAQRIELSSTLKQKDIQLNELIEEYKQEYQDAASTYREMHIKVETTKAACEDLARYGNALDQAILKFHSLKMEEINRIIEELWRNAYQGTDVDTVRIRSDNESGRGNRSYNYRVVMIKNQTEMDMRGRCSAGQKVLASIVIRLALAECFGTNCGLIALDEPTTNLDQQNIKGLAESLSQIIQIRRKQANFQLLVITHDEQFLREMNCADYTDVYWRVGRDVNQQSYIEMQNISEHGARIIIGGGVLLVIYGARDGIGRCCTYAVICRTFILREGMDMISQKEKC
ncbi:DNA repair protein rad50 [Lentithecium fluviatile CBS 122367]|uniref:DNA repair protein rad50 n=1 Tax=Lentithecium fluviatile CBS 122367 TaxID=1168545 RepID=A0A6G1IS41_9PLEO|nr:DNA repair protein rad50 [Lentithecium fluviatile CBS 122367]